MLSFLKRKRVSVGPHDFSAETEIACEAAEIFPMLDVTDNLFWRVVLGDHVERVGERDFHQVDRRMPDMDVHLEVLDREAGRMIELGVVCDPSPEELAASRECYRLEPIGPGLTRLTLDMSVLLKTELNEKAFPKRPSFSALPYSTRSKRSGFLPKKGPMRCALPTGRSSPGSTRPASTRPATRSGKVAPSFPEEGQRHRLLHYWSRKLRILRLRLGCLSFLSALASIWRMRSRVTENCWPTSSSV
ncbi:hypothetical protein J2X37_002348 [Croceicoccus sp. BE223]|nr:hypothetical protein [Croceicoccus sp. BE223]